MTRIAIALFVALTQQPDGPKLPAAYPGTEGLIANFTYRPKVGDRVVVGSFMMGSKTEPAAPTGCVSAEAFTGYMKTLQILDLDGVNEMLKRGDVYYVAHGTPVLILDIQSVTFKGSEEATARMITVRYTDGPLKGKTGYTLFGTPMRLVKPNAVRPEARPVEKQQEVRVFPGADGLVKDETYQPKVGDEAALGFFLLGEKDKPGMPVACVSSAAFREYERTSEIGDYDGITEMKDEGKIYRVPLGTPVLVLDIEGVTIKARNEVTVSMATVRYLGGPHEGKKGYVPSRHVIRLVKPVGANKSAPKK